MGRKTLLLEYSDEGGYCVELIEFKSHRALCYYLFKRMPYAYSVKFHHRTFQEDSLNNQSIYNFKKRAEEHIREITFPTQVPVAEIQYKIKEWQEAM